MTFQYNFPLSLGSGSSMDFGLKLSQLFKNPKICYGFKFNINYWMMVYWLLIIAPTIYFYDLSISTKHSWLFIHLNQ